MIRTVSVEDAGAICAIYNRYVTDSTITFEEQPVIEAEMRARIRENLANYPWLVFEENSELAGYAYATRWRTRAAYRHSVECTVYVSPDFQRRGIGRRLYAALIEKLRLNHVHAVIGGIALPNPASIGLHESFGFKKVAHFEEVGWKLGQWIDVGYWQLTL